MTAILRQTAATLAVTLACASGMAATFAASETIAKEVAIDPHGTLLIKNPVGNVDVIGTDGQTISIVAQKVLRGVDPSALEEARDGTQPQIIGSPRARVLQTALSVIRGSRWASAVHYTVRLPRSVQIRIASNSSDHIRLVNITGSVTVTNVNGAIVLENVTGRIAAESINGDIRFQPASTLSADTRLSTVNGQIEVSVADTASFQWTAETVRGDLLTTLGSNAVRGRFQGAAFRGVVNSSRGPRLTTSATMGNVFLLKKGTTRKSARSLRGMTATADGTGAPQPMNAGPALTGDVVRMPTYQGDLVYVTRIGTVGVGQVQGSVRVEMEAGDVQFGMVHGSATIVSRGGPLDLGDVFGVVNAETKAGDIMVRAARGGGSLTTGGGIIRVFYAGAPMKLRSGGGDIFVRQSAAGIDAETRSGDITINLEPAVRTAPVSARTAEGNIILTVSPRFAADIEATVLTDENGSEAIRIDLAGMTVQRERVGGRIRVRATGKINGGGERVILTAEDGTIQISGQSVRPLISPAQ